MIQAFFDVLFTWQFIMAVLIIFFIAFLAVIISLYNLRTGVNDRGHVFSKSDKRSGTELNTRIDSKLFENEQGMENSKKNDNSRGTLYVPASTYDILRKEKRIHPSEK